MLPALSSSQDGSQGRHAPPLPAQVNWAGTLPGKVNLAALTAESISRGPTYNPGMPAARRLLLLAVALLALTLAQPGRAAPMQTDFATLQKNASLVVLGSVHQAAGPNNTTLITVDVDTVIRGHHALGPMPVKESPDGHVMVNNVRVVAFIDPTGALRWVGTLVAGPSLEKGVIHLQGFFDFNAHLVRPGTVTLAQLKTLLATGTLDQTFDATLAFRDGHGGVAPSSHTFTVQWSPFTRQLHVTGASPSCLAPSSLSGLEWNQFDLDFDDTCRGPKPNAPTRALELEGRFTGVDAATGHIRVQLVPSVPFMTEKEYAAFDADGTITTMTSVVDVALSDGTHWTWRVGQDLLDDAHKAHAPGGMSSSSTMKNGKTTSKDTYGFHGGVTITLSPGADVSSPGGNARGLLTLVDSGVLASCVLSRPGHKDRTCRLTPRPSIVSHR